jgi:hypothetical protein
MGRECSMHWEKNAYRVFLGKPEGYRLLQDITITITIILRWIRAKDGDGLDSSGSELGPVESLCTQ